MGNNININWKNGIAWSADLETGYETIDLQHKRIFKLLSDLVEVGEKKEETEYVLEKTLDFLIDYVAIHFADEEQLQIEFKYPAYEEHKKFHDNFKTVVGEFRQKYETDGASDALNTEVNSTIVIWLIKHIKGEDAKMAKYIRERQ